MKRELIGLFSLVVIVALGSCKTPTKQGLRINLTYQNADKLVAAAGVQSPKADSGSVKTPTWVFLQEVPYGKDLAPAVLDSVLLKGNSGSLELTAGAKAQGVFELVFGDNLLAVPIINDAPTVDVSVDLAKRDEYYQVKGSPASQQLEDLIDNYGKKSMQIDQAFTALDSLSRKGAPDSVVALATESKNNALKDLNAYLKQFMDQTSNPILAVLALGWASRSLPRTDFELAMNNLVKKYPDNAALVGMKKSYEAQLAEANKKQDASSWVGKPAPELILPDPDGKSIALSSFKGKYVLVDFWASWCGPCRQENPNVVKAFNKFKNKNFAILGVSLDKDKDAWKKAIGEDKLDWTQVSDLKYWNSKAVDIFKFEGIPFNVLVDPDGKIVAQELRGQELENELTAVLK